MAPMPVHEPFPISYVGGRYLLFDVHVISHVRKKHNICGVLIGTIPNLSQQNVFLGVPLELMPEEARALVEGGYASVVDDAETHRNAFFGMKREDRLDYLKSLDRQGMDVALNVKKRGEDRSVTALKKKGLERVMLEKSMRDGMRETSTTPQPRGADPSTSEREGGSLFESMSPLPSSPKTSTSETNLDPYHITPTTSYQVRSELATLATSTLLPAVLKSYPLFCYLQSKGYFSTPGLRFGCHYSVYPGDPLRFHSHFLATGLDWDEEFDLLDLVGGGRLGTGVKKAYLIGGEEPKEHEKGDVRAFSIEWGGM